MAYGDFKNLPRRTTSDKVLHNMSIDIAKNPKYDRYQRGLNSMIYNLFDKTFSASHANKFTGCAVGAKTLAFQDKSAIMQNQ